MTPNYIHWTTPEIESVFIKAEAVDAVFSVGTDSLIWLSGHQKPIRVIENVNSVVRELVIRQSGSDE